MAAHLVSPCKKDTQSKFSYVAIGTYLALVDTFSLVLVNFLPISASVVTCGQDEVCVRLVSPTKGTLRGAAPLARETET